MKEFLFPSDFQRLDSFQDLEACGEDSIFHFTPSEVVEFPPLTEFGAPRSWSNPDFVDQRRGSVFSNGWAVLKVHDVYSFRNIFLAKRSGEIVLPFPQWRVGGLIAYYGDSKDEIFKRLRMNPLVNQMLALCRSPLASTGSNKNRGTIVCDSVHGHWIFEELLPVSIWEQLRFPYPVFAVGLKQYQRELLSRSEFPPTFIDAVDEILYFDSIFLLVPFQPLGNLNPSARYGFNEGDIFAYNQVHMNWQSSGSMTLSFSRGIGQRSSMNAPTYERIFIVRDRRSIHSVCVNEDSVIRLAESHGFVVIDPSKLSGEQEAGIFYNAKIVMGTLGGGLENIIFCKPGTCVIAISGEDSWRITLSSIAAFGGLSLTRIRCTQFCSMDPMTQGRFSGYVADLSVISTAIKSTVNVCESKSGYILR